MLIYVYSLYAVKEIEKAYNLHGEADPAPLNRWIPNHKLSQVINT